MEKSDIKEIRKAVKGKSSCISWVYGLYVDSENNACYEKVMRLADMEEAAQFRHQTIFQKVISPSLGKDSFAAPLLSHQEMLLSMRSLPGKEISEFEEFRNLLLEGITHTDPYYATLARVIYDVPAKSKDGLRLEDGTAVYEALLFSVCPAALSRPVLGFDLDEVAELNRRWQIGNPKSGFLYPAYADRGEDRSLALIHSSRPEEEVFLNSLFQIDTGSAPVSVQAQKELFASVLGQMDITVETAAAISETIAEKAAEEGALLVEPETVRKIAAESGADPEVFDEIYGETIGDTPLTLAAVADTSVTVKTDSAVIKVPADRAQLIKTSVIDGREYILIPADGEVTVNGTPVISSRLAAVKTTETSEAAEESSSEDDFGAVEVPADEIESAGDFGAADNLDPDENSAPWEE